MVYQEQKDVTLKYKEQYLQGIESIIDSRQKEGAAARSDYTKDIFTDAPRYRNDFRKMLGWPLVGHSDGSTPDVSYEKLASEDGYDVYRLHISIIGELILTGLLFKHNGDQKLPMCILQHGGQGTPELISGIYGSTSNYNDMLTRVFSQGVNVFAPQLMIWDPTVYGASFDRASIDARLKRVGSSIAALEVYAITRAIDLFEKSGFADSFGMVGLSYGGFYTLFTAAADTRIKSAISCSFFNKRDAQPWTNWVWKDSAYRFDDAEIACLVYPRRLCLQMGDNDQLFDYRQSIEAFDRIREMCRDVGTDWVKLMIFEGKHEFCKDDTPIKQLIKDLKKVESN